MFIIYIYIDIYEAFGRVGALGYSIQLEIFFDFLIFGRKGTKSYLIHQVTWKAFAGFLN